MADTFVSLRDLQFLLYDVLQVESLTSSARYSDHDRDVFNAVLETADAIARDHFAPHAALVDSSEPTFDGNRVHIIPEVQAALRHYIEAGLMGATFDTDVGGLQFPMVIGQACQALFSAANISTTA
jgi:alkylation response protein AidB-like acyl-CoA dehydrogenase